MTIEEYKKGKWAGIFDRFMDSWDVIVAKLTSGKFLAVTFDTIGYFAGVVICGYLTIKGKVDESVFIAVLGSYGLLVQKTRESYFGMKIEKPETKNGEKDEKIDTSTIATSPTDVRPS